MVPYAYNSQEWVTYENQRSIKLKVTYDIIIEL